MVQWSNYRSQIILRAAQEAIAKATDDLRAFKSDSFLPLADGGGFWQFVSAEQSSAEIFLSAIIHLRKVSRQEGQGRTAFT